MAYREVSVSEIREVLRLWLGVVPGLPAPGLRTIAGHCGVDRKTVRGYVEAAQAAGLPRDAGVEALDDGLIGAVAQAVRPTRPNGHGATWDPRPNDPKDQAALGKPAAPGDAGGSNLPQTQNNSSSATFRTQHRRTPPAREIRVSCRLSWRLRARFHPTNQPPTTFCDALGMLLILTLGRDGLLPRTTHISVAESDGCGFSHAHPFMAVFSITGWTTKFVERISPDPITPATTPSPPQRPVAEPAPSSTRCRNR